jgi:hypothetical protein
MVWCCVCIISVVSLHVLSAVLLSKFWSHVIDVSINNFANLYLVWYLNLKWVQFPFMVRNDTTLIIISYIIFYYIKLISQFGSWHYIQLLHSYKVNIESCQRKVGFISRRENNFSRIDTTWCSPHMKAVTIILYWPQS